MARLRRPETASLGVVPEELRHQLHPIWRDPEAIRSRFPDYVTEADLSPLRIRLVYFDVLRRWAEAHGFMSVKYPAFVDWHRLRAASLEQARRVQDISESKF